VIDVASVSHTKWECKYHVLWIPKYRKKSLYGELRRYLGSTFRELADYIRRQEQEDRHLDQMTMFEG